MHLLPAFFWKQVAGQSAAVLEHSRSFSSLLGQLMQLSADDRDSRALLTQLHAIQQTALKIKARQDAAKAAAKKLDKAAALAAASRSQN
jgi:hypothetical protein